MPHNPLTALLKKVLKEAIIKEHADPENTYSESRRMFLKNSSLTVGGLALIPSVLQALPAGKKPIITIVGAGMAGLNAAYQLKKMGYQATVFEAAARTGGRMFTLKDKFGKNLTTDIGGEFVDTTHTDILQLVEEMGLELYDLRKDNFADHTFYFEGKFFSEDDLKNAILPFAEKMEADIHSLPEKIDYTTAASFQYLDQLSITEYISSIGITGWLYNFLNVTLTREYGMEASEQSAINFLGMFVSPGAANNPYELFGHEHEVMKIKGGSQHLTDAVYSTIKTQVMLQHTLQSIDKKSGGYSLVFNTKGKTKTVYTDYLLLAIPFTVLRKVKINVSMPAEKLNCINNIGYGNSGKFIIGVNSKPWRSKQQKGYTFTDLPFGCGWDSTLMQSGKEGSFTVFGGGNFMNDICDATDEKVLKDLLPQLESIYPGISTAYNQKKVKFCWSKYQYTQAAYSAFKKGQWSTIAGWEIKPVENIFFAGEHTSSEFQGYMNGAAQTGRIAAEMITAKIAEKAS